MEGHFKRDHKATSEGALQSAVNHKLKQLIGERQLVVSVTDTGIGIAQEDLGKLFQKFSRLEDVMAHSIPGTGLGLYISRALVELNHGRIWAESEGRGKGATFRFTLPLAAATPEIKKLDAAVPQAKDAKPLSRMGGDPGLNGASDGMLKPQPKSVVSEQVTSDPTSFRPVGTSLGRPNSVDPPADEEGTSLGRQAVRAETREGNDISKTGGDKLELDKQEDSSDDVSENDKPKLPVSMAAKLEAAKARHRDNGRLPSAEGKNGNSGPGKVSKEDEEVPKNE